MAKGYSSWWLVDDIANRRLDYRSFTNVPCQAVRCLRKPTPLGLKATVVKRTYLLFDSLGREPRFAKDPRTRSARRFRKLGKVRKSSTRADHLFIYFQRVRRVILGPLGQNHTLCCLSLDPFSRNLLIYFRLPFWPHRTPRFDYRTIAR